MRFRTMILGLVLFFGSVAALGLATQPDEGDVGPAVQVGQRTQFERSGELHDMLEEHRVMLEQMQADVSPAMRERMSRDPMWQMLRTGEWARLDEEHQREIDRMLGIVGE